MQAEVPRLALRMEQAETFSRLRLPMLLKRGKIACWERAVISFEILYPQLRRMFLGSRVGLWEDWGGGYRILRESAVALLL